SEERRVGKECYQPCRSRRSAYHYKNHQQQPHPPEERRHRGTRAHGAAVLRREAEQGLDRRPRAVAGHADLFFFKQKTPYELVGSDWSSDVCSSDLRRGGSACSSPRLRCCAGTPIWSNAAGPSSIATRWGGHRPETRSAGSSCA